MPTVTLDQGLSLHCTLDDYLWPWESPTPVLMMHGFARNARFWDRWVPPIAESRRVYRPDLLASDAPPEGYRCTPEKIGAGILALLDTLSLPRVHWVGESSGGIIGLLLAASHPERIASLVLCNTPTRISDEIKRIYALDQQSTAAAIRAHGVGEWCRRTLGYRLDLDHASEELRGWVIAEMDKTRRDIAAALHECFESIDSKPLLGGISAPVLLLSGDKSRIASEQQKILVETLPNGRLELFAGYGHGVNLLQPERCARSALTFWRTVEEAAT
jgi:3-oxoadipate enol-lactonase